MLYTISDSMLSCWKFFLLMISWSDSWLSCRPFENISVPLPTYISYIHTYIGAGGDNSKYLCQYACNACMCHTLSDALLWLSCFTTERNPCLLLFWMMRFSSSCAWCVCMYVCMYVYNYMYCMYVVSSSAVQCLFLDATALFEVLQS